MASENAQCGELRSISAPFNLKRTVSNIQCTASVSQLALVNSSSRQNLLFVLFFFSFFHFLPSFFSLSSCFTRQCVYQILQQKYAGEMMHDMGGR